MSEALPEVVFRAKQLDVENNMTTRAQRCRPTDGAPNSPIACTEPRTRRVDAVRCDLRLLHWAAGDRAASFAASSKIPPLLCPSLACLGEMVSFSSLLSTRSCILGNGYETLCPPNTCCRGLCSVGEQPAIAVPAGDTATPFCLVRHARCESARHRGQIFSRSSGHSASSIAWIH